MNHIKQLDELIKRGHYDVIHVHSCHTSYIGLMVAWKNGIKIRFAHAHTAVKEKLSLKEAISRRTGIILMKIFATKRLACSRDAAVYIFGKHSLQQKSMLIIPNAIETRKFRYNKDARMQIREELGIEASSFVVGTVGRMSEEKNQIFLIDIFEQLKKLVPESYLLLVGNGDKKSEIEKVVEEKGLTKSVIFTGNRADVYKILSAMDVFVLPSLYEGSPVAGIEAGANGLPIIMSDTITRELDFLEGAEYISLQSSAGKWANKIVQYKNKGRFCSSIDKMLEQGYDIKKSARKMEKIYGSKN